MRFLIIWNSPTSSQNTTLRFAVFTRDTFKMCHFTIENQYNRNVNLPQVNVSRVNTTFDSSLIDSIGSTNVADSLSK